MADKISKAELVDQLAQETGLSKAQSGKALTTLVDLLAGHLERGHAVTLTGLGTFEVKDTQARTGVKPGTSEKIEIPAGKKIRFKPSSTLKASLK